MVDFEFCGRRWLSLNMMYYMVRISLSARVGRDARRIKYSLNYLTLLEERLVLIMCSILEFVNLKYDKDI